MTSSRWIDDDLGVPIYIQTSSLRGPLDGVLPRFGPPIVAVNLDLVTDLTDAELGQAIRRASAALNQLKIEEGEYYEALNQRASEGGPRRPKSIRRAAVYVMVCRDRYKVGVSIDPPKRLAQVARGTTDPVQMLQTRWFASEGEAYGAESRIHELLAAFRTKGEWFALDQAPDLKELLAEGLL